MTKYRRHHDPVETFAAVHSKPLALFISLNSERKSLVVKSCDVRTSSICLYRHRPFLPFLAKSELHHILRENIVNVQIGYRTSLFWPNIRSVGSRLKNIQTSELRGAVYVLDIQTPKVRRIIRPANLSHCLEEKCRGNDKSKLRLTSEANSCFVRY